MAWIPDIFRRREILNDLSEEMRLHMEERAAQLIAEGMSAEEADRRARIAFGNRAILEERSHEVWQWPTMESAWADVRVALRQLRRTPGFTVTAIFTLALAIGANAVVFSVMNAFIIRPLNVPDSQNLYGIARTASNDMGQSYPDYLDLRDRNHSFDDLAAYNITEAGLDTGNNPTRVWIEEASGNYFDALKIHPYLGRFFHAADEHGPESAPYAVLSYAYWRSHFHNDGGVIGRVIRLNKHSFTIVGVAPQGFNGTLMVFIPDLFVPLVDHTFFGTDEFTDRSDRWLFMAMGHLKTGVTKAQAIGDINSIAADLAKTYPKDDAKTTFTLAQPSLYGDYVGRPIREFLTGLLLLSGLILLAACANLGSLFAARAADRSKEVALRLALGSSRKRILRALFTESILVSIAGGGVGLAGSVALLNGLSTWRPISRWPLQLNVNPDARVYAVAVLLALVSGFLFGAVAVKQVLRTNPYEVIKTGAGGRTGKRLTTREILLVTQIAICAVLVTSSLVAIRGLARSLHDDFGFDVQNRLLIGVDLGMAAYSGDRVPIMQKRMIEALQTIPGVEAVGLADNVPLGDSSNDANVFTDDTQNLTASKAAADATVFSVSPEYFRASGTILKQGRSFTWQDSKDAPPVAVVNGEFARKLFGAPANAMGRYFKEHDGKRVQVVGIVEDGKYSTLTEDPVPVMFLPIVQSPSVSSVLVVQSNGDPLRLAAAIRSKLHDMDSGLPVYIQTRLKSLDSVLFGPRMATISLGVLGIMGAMLSITGIFGMAAYSVSRRLRELGIRIALGAKRKEVLQAALGRAIRLLAFGSVAGLILGVLASRVLSFVVYEATPRDPLVLAGVVLAMALLGLVATWIPAQRALGVNPLVLLRED